VREYKQNSAAQLPIVSNKTPDWFHGRRRRRRRLHVQSHYNVLTRNSFIHQFLLASVPVFYFSHEIKTVNDDVGVHLLWH
jgi:hypothetical protein